MPFCPDPDYKPLRRPRQIAVAEGEVLNNRSLPRVQPLVEPEPFKTREEAIFPDESAFPETSKEAAEESFKPDGENWSTRNGHGLTFVALFLYTAIAYFRPYELWPALSWTRGLPFWMAIGMLAIFIPSQFVTEGSVTARPKEVNLVLLLGLIAIISIPQAMDRSLAWDVFYTIYIKTIIVFIVMVNALRTERRLRAMILLAVITGGLMSITALLDYSAGKTGIYVDRATVAISNMFGEPNSLAMHLVIMIPIALMLALSSANVFKKLLYLGGTVAMIAGVFATFSRGGFLGLVVVGLVLAWKLGRRNRLAVVGIVLLAVMAALLFAPGGYGARVVSIFNPGSEASASARRELLTKSVWVALTSPFLGVGIGNLRVVLIHDQVGHNAFTEIAGDMGLIALTLYLMFLIVPYKRLSAIERETIKEEHHSRYYYLAVGLQASLIGFMVSSFFLSVAYEWYGYFLVAYAVSFRRLYQNRRVRSNASSTAINKRGFIEA